MAGADPKKQQMEYILIFALVFAALFIGFLRFKKQDKKVEDEFSKENFNKKLEEIKLLEQKVPIEEAVISYDVKTNRIPFKGPFEGEKIEAADENVVLPDMVVSGIVWNSRRPQAIIDKKVYDLEDEIIIGDGTKNAKIKEITRDGVSLRYKGKSFILKTK